MTAPDRIGLISNGLGQWALAARDEADIAVHYTRRDPAALAGDELVQAMIGAMVEEAALTVKPVDVNGDKRYFRIPGFHEEGCCCKDDDLITAVFGLVDRIRALRPDAAAALARALQAERVKALEEAAKAAALVADRCRSQMNGTTLADASYRLAEAEAVDKAVAAIRALKEAP